VRQTREADLHIGDRARQAVDRERLKLDRLVLEREAGGVGDGEGRHAFPKRPGRGAVADILSVRCSANARQVCDFRS
jgi:hypothetical protein